MLVGIGALALLAGAPTPGAAQVAPHIEVAEWAESPICEEALIHLEVLGVGDPERTPLDVMLVLNGSGSMGVPPEDPPIDHEKEAAKLLVDELDPAQDKVGFVSFATTATLVEPLTSDFDQVKDSIDLTTAEGRTNIGDGVFDAQAELDANGRVDAMHVIVLVSDGVANERHVGPGCITCPIISNVCTQDAVNQAATAKANGTTIFTIGLNLDYLQEECVTVPPWDRWKVEELARDTLQTMATPPPEDYYFEAPEPTDLEGIFFEIAGIITRIAGRDVTVVEVLPPYLHYIPGSAEVDGVGSEPTLSGGDQILTWYLGLVSAGDVHTIDFAVTVDTPDAHLLMGDPGSHVDYIDYQGNPQSVPFPEIFLSVAPCFVGGIVDIISADRSDSLVGSADEGSAGPSVLNYIALAGAAAGAIGLAAGGRYARRRWLS